MTPEQIKLRIDVQAQAIEYGYFSDPNTGDLRAPLGKFEGEPWYSQHYWQAALDGEGESFGNDERTECDVFEVTDDERIAFELDSEHAYILLRYSESGFVGLERLTQTEYEALQRAYAESEDT